MSHFKCLEMHFKFNLPFALLLMFASKLAWGEETIRLVADDWPPYQYSDAKGKAKGICVEVVERVFEQLGKKVEIDFLPWQRAQKNFISGMYHGQLCVGKTEIREKNGKFPNEPVLNTKWYPYKNSNNQHAPNIRELSDFHGFSIGYVKGTTYTPEIWQYLHQHNDKLTVSDDLRALLMLSHERFDYMIGESINIAYLLGSEVKGSSRVIEAAKTPMFTVPLYVLFSRKKQMKLSIEGFSDQLKYLKASPEYYKILAKYR